MTSYFLIIGTRSCVVGSINEAAEAYVELTADRAAPPVGVVMTRDHRRATVAQIQPNGTVVEA